MKIKTSELSGAQLDWAVAKCEGLQVKFTNNGEDLVLLNKTSDWWYPSESWAQGGPIIERKGITLEKRSDLWDATYDSGECWFWEFGPTPLVAAMRCYVASKLGNEVDLPVEIRDHKEGCPAIDGFGCKCEEIKNV